MEWLSMTPARLTLHFMLMAEEGIFSFPRLYMPLPLIDGKGITMLLKRNSPRKICFKLKSKKRGKFSELPLMIIISFILFTYLLFMVIVLRQKRYYGAGTYLPPAEGNAHDW